MPSSAGADQPPRSIWSVAAEALGRPYPVTASMVVLVGLVPFYIFIPELVSQEAARSLDTAVDRLFPLAPAWAIVYGAFYLFLILLPVLLIRDLEHVRRTVRAYLAVWLTAYGCFILYPTIAPRPAAFSAHGFGGWGLSLLYAADIRYNCFPSLHVAHSFVSALTSGRLHRGVGRFALLAASLVALSTLYTKQHYAVDVGAGILLAVLAHRLFLRSYRPSGPGVRDAEAAPVVSMLLLGALAVATACAWLVYASTTAQK